ncbi:MAG: T9SS type A sorting domain-containing protein, partial [Candidatus Stygibacter frigidus]|nr:T9SS type A sorting domain-containing protein [Candidatus Stygibacter frigidus]
DAEYIYLKSLNDIFSLEYDINAENLTVDLPEVIKDDCLYNYNKNKFALISATGIAGNIVRIPYQSESQGAWNVHFQIKDNGNSYDLEYLPEDIPELDRLISIYPNPFNPETNILFDISADSNVLIEIYNIKGQKVTTLVNKPFEIGSHKVTWNAKDQSSGIYLLKFNTAETSEMKKLILLK